MPEELITRDAPQIGRTIDKKDYYDKVRRESKMADEKGLPFQFRVVKPSKPSNYGYVCDCDEVYWVNRDTYIIQCKKCNELKKTSEMKKLDSVSEETLQITISQYKDVSVKPGPFTKNPRRDKSKGRWV